MASLSLGPRGFSQNDDESGPRPRKGLEVERDARDANEKSQRAGTEASRWHAQRHHAILRAHPEVRRLFGTDPATALWIGGLVVAQLGIAISLHRSPWWLVLIVVQVVGAPIAHALGVLIHECAHNLAFRVTWKNKVLAIVANLGLVGPGAMTFRHQHLLHHRLLGDVREPEGGDTQAPTRKEI